MSDFESKLQQLSPDKRALFELLKKQGSAGARKSPGTVSPDPKTTGPAPLSFAQQRLWYLERVHPGTAAYNVPVVYRITGAVDVPALEASLRELSARHAQLRTAFRSDGNEPLQETQASCAIDFEQVVLASTASDNAPDEALRLATEAARMPFDLARAPLFRVRLYRDGHTRWLLAFVFHHIICDAWSIGIFLREFGIFYGQHTGERKAPLPAVTAAYVDFAIEQRRPQKTDAWQSDLAFWQKALRDIPAELDLLTDKPRPEVQTFQGAKVFSEVPADLRTALEELAGTRQATLFMVLLAAWQVLLFRYTGQEDFAVGTPVTGRDREETEGVFGFFVNMLPLPGRLSSAEAFASLLGRTRDTVIDALGHTEAPLERIVEDLRVERNPSRTPLFQTGFGFTSGGPDGLVLTGAQCVAVPLDTATAKFDLTLEIVDERERLMCSLEYDSSLFGEATCERMVRHYASLLRSIAADPEQQVGQLPLIAPDESAALLSQWSGVSVAYPRNASVPELFEQHAATAPDRTAVVAGDLEITYAELNVQADRIAASLRSRGLAAGTLIGLASDRSPLCIVAMLGILKAGMVYVPLDTSYPAERLRFMVADAQVRYLIAPESRAGEWQSILGNSTDVEVIVTERILGDPALSVSFPRPAVKADSLAYSMYTSGSTGEPKGVCVSHRAIVRLVRNADFMRLDANEVFLQFAAIAFDAATLEIWGPLLNGGRLVLFTGSASSVEDLKTSIESYGITAMFLTTAFFNVVVETNPKALAELRQLIFGGDSASPVHVRKALVELPHCRLIHAYGPTENTTFTTCGTLDANRMRDWKSPPIGRPIANTRVYILDEWLRPVPPGIPGELYAGGDGVANGYWRRPELTAERFLADPFHPEPGARMYRTGDLARWLPSGEIEFIGRIDSQIKLRGFRIEPGEIEAAILRIDGVRACCVLLREDRPGDKRLVAYLATEQPGQIDIAELRSALRQKLPEYMLPAACVTVERIPLTPNGKVDRRALPAPQDTPGTSESSGSETSAHSGTATEKQIAAIWEKALGTGDIGRDSNFFEIGGHSLLLIRVHAELNRTLGREPGKELAIVDLFRYPTVRSLARFLDGEAGAVSPEPALASRQASSEPIAIIAMTGRFPGASGVEELWANLRAGVESIRPYSDEELRAAGVGEEDWGQPDYVKRGTSLAGADLFDARFFGFNPREAEITDPQHRLFLECSHEALERAGYDPETYAGRIGVFAGSTVSTYWSENLRRNRAVTESAGHLQVLIGNDKDFVASRVAYKLNLRGPAVIVQTACSTSLVAVHMACESLRSGGCEMALAGGVSIRFPQTAGYRYQPESIMSPDGHCRPFDEEAAGTVAGNGVGIVVLKRVSDAVRDGDTIEAVILGSAINNDGANKVGYTAPGVEGQAEVIRAAQRQAGVEPPEIRAIEAHGTGTNLGDPIEVAALRQVFAGVEEGRCALSSVKGNVGHLDAAAGVTGLIKAALQLKHRELAPTVHFRRANPKLGLDGSPFRVNAELTPLGAEGERLRMGVSSFGIGGTNAHVVLEQAPEAEMKAEVKPETARRWHLLPLSAKTETALDAATANLHTYLRLNPNANLADVAWTLQTGRTAHPYRRAIVCHSAAENTVSGKRPSHAPRVVFLFPGQGAQYPRMGEDLYRGEPVFREAFDECADLLLTSGFAADLRDIVFRADTGSELDETSRTQAALFAVSYSLAKLWMHWGVRPAAMLGHSVGEYVAACLAGVMTLAEAIALVAARGRIMQSMQRGSMLAVSLSESETVAASRGRADLAAVNAPRSCVLSGRREEIEEIQKELESRGVPCRILATSHAYHSALMEPAMELLQAEAARVHWQPPVLPYLSNVTGQRIAAEQATSADYWAQHMRRTVRFADCVETLRGDPDILFLEAGPGGTLGNLVRKTCGAAPVVSASLLENDPAALAKTAAQVWTAGAPLDWSRFSAPGRRLLLPTYPFEKSRFWITPDSESESSPLARKPIDDWFYAPTWERAVKGPGGESTACASLIFCDEPANIDGTGSVFVIPGDTFHRYSATLYAVNPAVDTDYANLLASMKRERTAVRRIVHAWALNSTSVLKDGFFSVIALVQSLGNMSGDITEFVVVGSRAYRVNTGDPVEPDASLLPAACRVISREYPHLRCTYVDAAPRTPLEEVLAMVREDGPASFAIRGRHKWFPVYRPVALAPSASESASVRTGGTYLITGGLRGAGLALAMHLARTAKANLILMGRSDPDEGASAAIAEMRSAGCSVVALKADVADVASLHAALADCASDINGIVHAAGIPGGGLIETQTRQGIAATLAAKVTGTRNLFAIFRDRPLDFFVVFSSQRSVIGVPGRVDYCAANAFLDAFATAHEEHPAFPVISIAWDSWREVGMGAGLNAFSGDMADAMATSEALHAFDRILAAKLPVVIVSTRDFTAVIERHASITATAIAEELAKSHVPAAHERPNLESPWVPPRNPVEKVLAGIWSELLGLDRIGVHDNFFDLGGDSVVGIQMIGRAARHGLRLTAKHIYQNQTVAELAALTGNEGHSLAEQGEITGEAPLTPIQTWFLQQPYPDRNHFNQAMLLVEDMPLRDEWVDEAFQALVIHHDALRQTFRPRGAAWVANYAPVSACSVERIDCTSSADADLAIHMESHANRVHRSMRLQESPLARCVRFYCGPQRPARILLVVHHLAVDLVSWHILLEDFELALQQAASQSPVHLPAKTTSFQNWAQRIRRHVDAGGFDNEIAYWRSQAEKAATPLPIPANARTAANAQVMCVSLDAVSGEVLLNNLPLIHGASLQDALLAAVGDAVTRWTRSSLIAIDLEGLGREPLFDDVDVSRTVGWFTPVYPVIVGTGAGREPLAHLRAIHKDISEIPNGGIGYLPLKERHNLPSAQVGFLYTGQNVSRRQDGQLLRVVDGLTGTGYAPSAPMPYAVSVHIAHHAGTLRFQWTYDREAVASETVSELALDCNNYLRELADLLAESHGKKSVSPDTARSAPEFDWNESEFAAIAQAVGNRLGS